MVKKNELVAETDRQKTTDRDLADAVALHALGITSSLVVQGKADVDDIAALVDRVANAFKASFTLGAALSGAADAKPDNVVQIATAKRGRGRPKKVVEAPALDASDVMNVQAEQPVKRGRGRPKKIVVAPVQETAETNVPASEPVATAEQPVKRGRGRPRKVPVTIYRFHKSSDPVKQAEFDQEFLTHYPAVCSEKESLKDIGDGKMTCLIDGKRVSFLTKVLAGTYGMSFKDYKRLYGLGESYPPTPPKFRKAKRKAALAVGLGHFRKKDVVAPEQTAETPKTARKRNSRRIEVEATAA